MPSPIALRRAQISNAEGTHGTAEAALEILYYEELTYHTSSQVNHMFQQDRNNLSKNIEAPEPVSELIELEMSGPVYDRGMVFAATNAIRGNVSASQPDSMNEPNHYLWAFTPALTTPNTPDETNGIETYTLEWGDNTQGYETSYLFTTSLTIEGAPNELCTFSWNTQGRQVTESSFTGGLSDVSAAWFPFNQAKFYLETDAYANIGSTQLLDTLKGFTWTFETMFSARFTADGNLYFTGLNEDRKTVQLELTLLRNSNSEAIRNLWDANSTAYIRIELLNDTEMDSGQSNPPYIWLDGAFKVTEWPEMDDEDGMSVETITLEAFYDATATKFMDFSIGTTMSALPS